MKKGKILKTLAVFGAFLSAPLLLTGCQTNNEINFRVDGEYIQWTEDGKTWTNLVELDDLQGIQGVAGKQVEFQKTSTHIQWRYIGDSSWNNLVALEDISGEDLTAEICTITYDFNLGEAVSSVNSKILSAFERDGFSVVESKVNDDNTLILKYSQKSEKGDYFDLYDMDSIGLKDYFLGWYVDDVKVNKLNVVGGDIELTAKWTKDLSTLICMETANYDYYEEDGFYRATAKPVQDHVYSQFNNMKLFNLNDLTIHDNKFYKITSFYATYNGVLNGDERDIDLVLLPNTISDSTLESLFENNSRTGFPMFFISRNNLDGTIKTDNWIDVSKDCYIGDYVIRPILNTTFGIIEYIYKVDYTKREATLINTFVGGDYTLKNNFDNNDKVIGDFVVNKEGSEIEIKVTSIADNWIKPLYTFDINSIPNEINLYLIIGENINYIGSANHVKTEDFDETNIDTEKDYINYHLFSLKTIPGDEVDCRLTESGIPEMGVISTIATIYYYSEEQPIDTKNNYWHYDTDGKTPIVWEVTTGE